MKILISFLTLLFCITMVQAQDCNFVNKICIGNHFQGPTGNGGTISPNDDLEPGCNYLNEPLLIQHIGDPAKAIRVEIIFPDIDLTVPFTTGGVLDDNGQADNTEFINNPGIFEPGEQGSVSLWSEICSRDPDAQITQTIEVCLQFHHDSRGAACDFSDDSPIQGGRPIQSDSGYRNCYEVDLTFCCGSSEDPPSEDPLPSGGTIDPFFDSGKISNNTGNQHSLGLASSNEELNNLNHSLNSRSIESEITVYPNPVSDILYINGHYNELTIKNVNNQIIYNKTNLQEIDISNFESGMYYLILSTDTDRIVKPIVKL